MKLYILTNSKKLISNIFKHRFQKCSKKTILTPDLTFNIFNMKLCFSKKLEGGHFQYDNSFFHIKCIQTSQSLSQTQSFFILHETLH